MSMLTGQADELRKAALIQGAHARYDVANLLTDAADTILSLRDRTQDLQAENAKLRELGGFMLMCISQNHDCADCLVNGEHCEISYIESDARELGVKVPA